MKITFLGTSSMVPTKNRNQQGVFINYGSDGILIDCGEGIQKQFKIANISLTKITKILITHWHGDHVFGLPGVLQTLNSSEYSKNLEIYGPKGIKKKINLLLKTFPFDNKFKFVVKEVSGGGFFTGKMFTLSCLLMQHSVPTVAYSFIEHDKRKILISKAKKIGLEKNVLLGNIQKNKKILFGGKTIFPNDISYIVKGKKISLIPDTCLNDNCFKIAKDSDVLICESSYLEKDVERAKKYFHLTAKSAGVIAKKSDSKKLVLTHFSNRYKNIKDFLVEAKKEFKKTICAKDFLEIKI